MKETNELFGFIATGVSTGYAIAEDDKVDFNDLTKLLPLILAGQEGVGGINAVPGEQKEIGVAEKQIIRANVASKLTNIDSDIASDWEDALVGFLSSYRLGQRIGAKEEREAIVKELQDGASIEQIAAKVA